MQYKVVLNASNKLGPLVQVLAAATATPGGYTSIGTFEHGATDLMVAEVSHVIFQHVQELMYKQGYLDMQIVHITWPGKVVATAVTVANQSVQPGTEKQLTVTTTPANISRKRVLWSTRDDKIAYIDPRGKLIARAYGETVGRVQVVDGGAYKEFPIVVEPYVPPEPQIVIPAFITLDEGPIPTVGQYITGGGTFSAPTSMTYAVKWFRDGVEIAGQTMASYGIVSGDIGKKLTFQITATNGAGSTSSLSAPTPTVVAA